MQNDDLKNNGEKIMVVLEQIEVVALQGWRSPTMSRFEREKRKEEREKRKEERENNAVREYRAASDEGE